MRQNAIARLILFAGIAVTSLSYQALASSDTDPVQGLYSLNMEYKGDGFNIDQDLTLGDCFEALPRNQTDKGLSFACDLQP